MKARQIGLGIFAAASLALAASAFAHPGEGGRMGHGATGAGQAQGRHAGMQERMAERMAQHRDHGAGRQGGAAAGGCPMGQQAAQGEHKH